jgi:hypothetical protein
MLVCGKSFSQTDTINKVTIDTSTAKKIGIDLVKGDECKEERFFLKKNIALLNEKISLKDSIITDKKQIIYNQKEIIESKDDLIEIGNENLSNAQKQTEIYKKQASWSKAIAAVSVFFSFVILIE